MGQREQNRQQRNRISQREAVAAQHMLEFL
jgi:hypothetical protein